MRSVLTIGIMILIAGAVVARGSRVTAAPAPAAAVAGSAEIRESDIRFYEARVRRDPYGARDRAMLASLYLSRSRETGSTSDLERARLLAGESYRLRRVRNSEAVSVLVGSLMAEHRFQDAWTEMARLAAADPTPVALATLGEIALELGRYREADSLFSGLSVQRTQPEIAPRYARWLELNGKSGEARELLELVRAELEGGFRVPPAQLAWFDLRIGDLALHHGRPDLAERRYARGLALLPDDPRLLTAMARSRLAQRRYRSARDLGERALQQLLDPATLAVLSEASEAMGDSAAAAEFARGMDVAVSRQTGPMHRGWALFLLDRGRRVDEVLGSARAELLKRRDVYGYDLAAWALYRAGQPAAAMPLADSALALGTGDALLHYHAARIAEAVGDSARARREFALVREIDPWFRAPAGQTRRWE